MDGKHFKVDEAVNGVNFPPFHPHCRTTTVKYDKDTKDRTRIARDKNGKNITVPFGMKYDEWKKWIDEESVGIKNFTKRPNKYIVDKIIKGTYSSKINKEKQTPHIKSTRLKGKSYLFDDVDPQELFNKYAGTGIMELDRKGNKTNKELCKIDFYIGVNGSDDVKTKTFKIHHSKNRTHISPYLEKRGKK